VRAIFFWFFGFLVRLWVLWVFLPAALIGWFAYGHWRFLGLRSAFAASAPFACGVGLSLCSCWFICVAVLPGCPAALAFPCFAFGLLALPLGCLPAALAFPCFHVGLFVLPLCGAALTFFAAAKKVSKESGSHRQLLGVLHSRIFRVVRARSAPSRTPRS
jgi:hypothetical protein